LGGQGQEYGLVPVLVFVRQNHEPTKPNQTKQIISLTLKHNRNLKISNCNCKHRLAALAIGQSSSTMVIAAGKHAVRAGEFISCTKTDSSADG